MVVRQGLQSDIDISEESAWLDSSGLELNQFTWSLPSVSVAASYHSRKHLLPMLISYSCAVQYHTTLHGCYCTGVIT